MPNNPKISYDIYETEEYFKKEVEQLKEDLTADVLNGLIEPESARKKLDMYLSMLIYLGVCVKWAEDEKFLNDNEFSAHVLYQLSEEKGKGDKKLKEAMKNL